MNDTPVILNYGIWRHVFRVKSAEKYWGCVVGVGDPDGNDYKIIYAKYTCPSMKAALQIGARMAKAAIPAYGNKNIDNRSI